MEEETAGQNQEPEQKTEQGQEPETVRTRERRGKAERLKLILREKSEPFFSEEEIYFLLREAGWDVRKAAYSGFLRKAEDDALRLPSGMSAASGRKYWLGLARKYRDNLGGRIEREE